MNKKQVSAITLDILAAVCTALCLFLLYRYIDGGILRTVLTAAFLLPAVIIPLYELACWSRKSRPVKKRNPAISTLILLGEDDRAIRFWDLTGKVGIIIGKGSDECGVDIDLSNTAFQTYIDPEHALLNYNGSGWWLEDTSVQNGVSVLRKGKELLIGRHAPVKIEAGDVICVAKYTRIAVN